MPARMVHQKLQAIADLENVWINGEACFLFD
jgi:hypothetical protein